MPGLRCARPGLAPAGHATIHQRGIAGIARHRAKAQPLHHAGAKALDQKIGPRDQIEQMRLALGRFQVQRQLPAAAMQRRRALRHLAPGAAGAGDAHHIGAEIGQHAAQQRHRADGIHLDHPDPGQRPGRRGGHRHPCIPPSSITSVPFR